MRHFIGLLFFALSIYAIWYTLGPEARGTLKNRVRPHVGPVTLIVGALLAGLVAMYLLRSINIL